MRRGRVVAPRCKHLLEEHERLTKQILALQRQLEALRVPDQDGLAGLQVGRLEALGHTLMRNVQRFLGLLDLMRREHPDLFGYIEEGLD